MVLLFCVLARRPFCTAATGTRARACFAEHLRASGMLGLWSERATRECSLLEARESSSARGVLTRALDARGLPVLEQSSTDATRRVGQSAFHRSRVIDTRSQARRVERARLAAPV